MLKKGSLIGGHVLKKKGVDDIFHYFMEINSTSKKNAWLVFLAKWKGHKGKEINGEKGNQGKAHFLDDLC